MPSVCRRIAALVVVACLGVALPAQVAPAQQGAGDQQYSDPLGDSGTSTTTASGTASTDTTTTAPGLSQMPQRGSSTPRQTPSRPTVTSPVTAAQLPNTGLDARVLMLLGAALLLGGLGLRLRSAPERF